MKLQSIMCLPILAASLTSQPSLYAATLLQQDTGGASPQPAPATSGNAAMPGTAVVLRFASMSEPSGSTSALAEQACPQPAPIAANSPSDTNTPPKLRSIPKVQDELTKELQKRLSKKMTVLVDIDPTVIPQGSLVFTGCFTRSDGGNAAERMVGFELGASHLAAHVKVLRKTPNGFAPVDEFDVASKGGKLLPPLGPIGVATHAATEYRETLSADAKRLAGALLKKLAKDKKEQEQAQAQPKG